MSTTATVLHGTRPDTAQALVDRLSALDPEQVDATVVPYTRGPEDWCQYARGCVQPSECAVSAADPLSGRRHGPTEYCARHAVQEVSWLLLDEARELAHNPGLISVEVWEVQR